VKGSEIVMWERGCHDGCEIEAFARRWNLSGSGACSMNGWGWWRETTKGVGEGGVDKVDVVCGGTTGYGGTEECGMVAGKVVETGEGEGVGWSTAAEKRAAVGTLVGERAWRCRHAKKLSWQGGAPHVKVEGRRRRRC
jgi:hypothetical protein